MSKSGKKKISKSEQSGSHEYENPGKHFRKLRTDKGLSTKEVSEITRISEVNLNAIENQDFEALPADTFTRGFITIYSDFLGADTPLLVARFMEEREKSRGPVKKSRLMQPRKVLSPKVLAEPSHVSSMTMAAVLLIIIVALFTGFCVYYSWNPFSFMFKDKDNMPPVMQNVFPGNATGSSDEPVVIFRDEPVSGQNETTPRDQPEDNSLEAENEQHDTGSTLPDETGQQPEGSSYEVELSFTKETRLQATIDGQLLADERVNQGDRKNWTANTSLHLVFYEPDSATILINGEPVTFPELLEGTATLQFPQ